MTKKTLANRPLTGKQRAMILERLKDKTAPNHKIIERAGYKGNEHTRSQIYLENMRKPEIRSKLDDVAIEMEETLITDVRQYRDSDKIQERQFANDTARWIHDKVKGRAKQQLDLTSTSVTLAIDLSGKQDG